MTKTTSFERMLSQYQGNLPDISDTNYTSELDFTLTEEVNKEIDNLKNDHTEYTNNAIAMAEKAAASKQQQLTDLAGLVKPAKELYDFWEAKKISDAKYTSWNTELKDANEYDRSLKAYTKEKVKPAFEKHHEKPERYGETWTEWLARNKGDGFVKDTGESLRINKVMEILINKSQTEEGWITKTSDGELIIGPEGIKYIEKHLRKYDTRYDLEIDSIINQTARENFVLDPESNLDISQKVRLLAPSGEKLDQMNAAQAEVTLVDNFDTTFPGLLNVKRQLPGMDQALSYMDIMNGQYPSEYVMYADMLLKDAYNDYYAANKNLVDKVGERRYKNKIFPQLYDKAQIYHKKFLNTSLASSIEENKKRNSISFSNRFRTEGIQAITGPKGFVSIFELQADGTKDNAAGFIKVGDLIGYSVKNGDLKGRDLLDVIDDPFMGRDKRMTTLQKLKPQFYDRLREIAIKDINEDLQLDEAETADDILQQTSAIAKQAEENNWTTDQVKAEAAKKIQELTKKHSVGIGHSAFKELNYLSLHGQTQAQREGNAITELEKQASNNSLLSSDLIAKLPPELQTAWNDKAKVLGLEGLTSTDLENADADIVALLKDLSEHATVDERLGPKFRLARTRALSVYSTTFNQLMKSDNRPDTLAAKQDNMQNAMDAVKKAFNTYGSEQEDERIWGKQKLTDWSSIVKNDAQVTQFISKDGKRALTTNLYWNDQEEQAIILSLEADKNGEPISGWFLDKSKLFPNLTPKELFKQRAEATADLREGDIGDIKLEDKFEFREIVKKGNDAKTGQIIYGSPDIAEEFLNGIKVEGADNTSTFRVDTRIPEFDPSQMTLRELFQLRIDHYGIWNDDIGLGIYDQPMKEIIEILETYPDIINYLGGGDIPFDSEMQDKLQLIKRKIKANQASSLGSLDNTYRKLAFLSDEDMNTYKGIVLNTGNERLANDPFSQLDTMTSEVAKVALQDLIALT